MLRILRSGRSRFGDDLRGRAGTETATHDAPQPSEVLDFLEKEQIYRENEKAAELRSHSLQIVKESTPDGCKTGRHVG